MSDAVERARQLLRDERDRLVVELAQVEEALNALVASPRKHAPSAAERTRSAPPSLPGRRDLKGTARAAVEAMPVKFSTRDVRDFLNEHAPGLIDPNQPGAISKVLQRNQDEFHIRIVSPGEGKRPAMYEKVPA